MAHILFALQQLHAIIAASVSIKNSPKIRKLVEVCLRSTAIVVFLFCGVVLKILLILLQKLFDNLF